MLCTLKVRRALVASEDELPYQLQITAQHAVGGAGGRLSDVVLYPHLPSLHQALRELHLPAAALMQSDALAELEQAQDRWLPLITNVNIPFETLTAAGFDLDVSE